MVQIQFSTVFIFITWERPLNVKPKMLERYEGERTDIECWI